MPIYSTVNAVPTMTSNTLPSGLVTYSSQQGTNNAWKAFDRNTSSFWETSQQQTCWIAYEFTVQKIIYTYTITSFSSAYNPRSFTFEGSNDGINWTILDTRINQSWVENSKKTFTIQNTNPYKSYKINVSQTGNSGATYACQITEIEMFEIFYQNKILLSYGDKCRSIKDNGVIYSDKAIIPLSANNSSNVTSDYTLSAGSNSDLAYRAIQGGTSAWSGTGWFRTVFVKKYRLGAYSIQAWSAPNQTPSTYRLMGSNDGVTWDEISKQSGLSWTANEIKIFPINTSSAYTHYELRDMSSLTTPLNLRSFQLFEYIGKDISMLIIDSATEDQFIKYGTDTIAFNSEIKRIKDTIVHVDALSSGKNFEHTIDMSKRRVDKIILG